MAISSKKPHPRAKVPTHSGGNFSTDVQLGRIEDTRGKLPGFEYDSKDSKINQKKRRKI